jgi:CHASE3 domain sensor protein
MFRDTTIKSRLAIGFGSVMLVMALVVLLMTIQFHEARKFAQMAPHHLAPQIKASADLVFALERQQTDLRDYAATGDRNRYREFQAGVARQGSAFADLRENLTEGNEPRELRSIEPALAELRRSEERVVNLVESGNSKQASAYHESHVRPLGDKVMDAATKIASHS